MACPTLSERPRGRSSQTVSMNIDSIRHTNVFGANDVDSFRNCAENDRIHIVEQPLPDGLCGAWHETIRTIFLHDRLNQRQRRCTLCHELIHARHHDPGCGSQYGIKCERRCRRETALALISPVDYGMAEEIYDGDAWMMAVELGVTIQVLEDYRQLLYDSGVCVQ